MHEDDENATTRYIISLRFQLKDMFALLKVNIVDEAYQLASKYEEKLNQQSKTTNKQGDNNISRDRINYSNPSIEDEPGSDMGLYL